MRHLEQPHNFLPRLGELIHASLVPPWWKKQAAADAEQASYIGRGVRA